MTIKRTEPTRHIYSEEFSYINAASTDIRKRFEEMKQQAVIQAQKEKPVRLVKKGTK